VPSCNGASGALVEFQGRSDVDAVQLAGVLVTELSRDEGADVAARRGVPGMAERLGHQLVPDVRSNSLIRGAFPAHARE
jgi:hypothetical protein